MGSFAARTSASAAAAAVMALRMAARRLVRSLFGHWQWTSVPPAAGCTLAAAVNPVSDCSVRACASRLLSPTELSRADSCRGSVTRHDHAMSRRAAAVKLQIANCNCHKCPLTCHRHAAGTATLPVGGPDSLSQTRSPADRSCGLLKAAPQGALVCNQLWAVAHAPQVGNGGLRLTSGDCSARVPGLQLRPAAPTAL